MKKYENRYELVHKVSKLAKEKEDATRQPVEDKKSNYIPTINDFKKKRNFVLEAYEELAVEKADPQC